MPAHIHNKLLTECSSRLVFMCFVFFSEQTSIISLNSINQLLLVIETIYVSFEIRTEHVYCLDVLRALKGIVSSS
jgi:hypothetical protein